MSHTLLNLRHLAGTLAVGAALAMLAPVAAPVLASPALHAPADDTDAPDELVMRTGQVLKGKIISETSTSIKFRLVMAGISTDIEYTKDQIKEIKRGNKPESPKDTPKDTPKPAPKETPKEAAKDDASAEPPSSDSALPTDGVVPEDGRKRYYFAKLTGEFGTQISQTPIRTVLKDAKNQKADVVIFYLDADFKFQGEDAPDDVGSFDEIFRAEEMVKIFAEDVPKEWDKAPKIVFWVKDAMAGAALFPFICPNIYMHSEGRIGGIGNLSQIFEGTGDEVVREKQRSLRLGHAEGWAIRGGYKPEIIKAMARTEYVLSARVEGDKVTLFEGMPSNPSEELLTDDGEKANMDTLQERVRGEGNDVLTLKPRLAQLLGVSKGTVDTKEELLSALDLQLNAVDVSTRGNKNIADKLMMGWKTDIARAQRQIIELFQQFRDVRVEDPGEFPQRTAARGKRLRILNQIKGAVKRYGEGLGPRWFRGNGIPGGNPEALEAWIGVQEEALKLDQLKDKK